MLSNRLTRKLEGLSDDALDHLEAQADLLLTMPGHRRVPRAPPLHLVGATNPQQAIAASRRALVASNKAMVTEQQARITATQAWVTQSRRLVATLRAKTAGKPRAIKMEAPRRALSIVRRAVR